jgi:hypothetical protein
MPKNESKQDFLHKISKDFVCIFQIFWIFSEIEAEWTNNLENQLHWLWTYCTKTSLYEPKISAFTAF